MSKKNFDDYYYTVAAQYQEMYSDLKEVEELCKQSVMNPDIYENMVKTLEPVKNSFAVLSYVKYLLDMPVKKHKQSRYNSQPKNLIANEIGTNMKKENTKALNLSKEMLQELVK